MNHDKATHIMYKQGSYTFYKIENSILFPGFTVDISDHILNY